ncbi:hypothetical protein SAMN05444172_9073 [Burkholderia sp. GAS332]|nr:hypothetical protein SAMN05444172_9073 [Burkholderia sp. GAS332]
MKCVAELSDCEETALRQLSIKLMLARRISANRAANHLRSLRNACGPFTAKRRPCRIERIGEALRHEGFLFKRNRHAPKRSATRRTSS